MSWACVRALRSMTWNGLPGHVRVQRMRPEEVGPAEDGGQRGPELVGERRRNSSFRRPSLSALLPRGPLVHRGASGASSSDFIRSAARDRFEWTRARISRAAKGFTNVQSSAP